MIAAVAFSSMGAASAQTIRARVDGNFVSFPEAQPVMVNNRVMVPVRGVFEHMSASVRWNESAQTVTAERGDDTIKLTINSTYATVNGREVRMDTAPMVYQGSTMVPLRFLSESLKASVDWNNESRIVEISTNGENNQSNGSSDSTLMRIEEGTVIPFKMRQNLSSNDSSVGDLFKANLDTNGANQFEGIPRGAILEGHVDFAQAKSGKTPGVLGLAFDRLRLRNGQSYRINATLIPLDSTNVDKNNDHWVAKSEGKDDNLKFVGYGAGAGAIVSLITKGNLLTDSLIGSALGFLFGTTQPRDRTARNVMVPDGMKFGIRLTRDLNFRENTATSQGR